MSCAGAAGSPTTCSASIWTSTGPVDFAAGQFALLTVPGIEGARAYSMVNFDRRAERLSFVVKKKPGGGVSEWLFGDDVEGAHLGVVAPLGHAIFQPGHGKHVLCIAGGSGIAGMMSILSRAGQESHFTAWDGHVFFGVRTARRRFLPRRAGGLPGALPGPTRGSPSRSPTRTSRPRSPPPIPGFAFGRGFVHAVAGESMKGRFADVRAWVAGPPPMVDASLRLLLREARLPPADIRYDKFS